MRSRQLLLVSLGATIMLLVAACGGSASTPELPTTEPIAPTATLEPSTPIEPEPRPTAEDVDQGTVSDAGGGALVDPDPNYRENLRGASFFTQGWDTDFSRHTVPFSDIISGGPGKDGIPPIDDPRFVTVSEADQWLGALEPVIALEVNGQAKAYPLQILTWHEIVNDEIAGVPVTVTFCPLCNSAVVFDRRLNGVVHDFGVSGNLRLSDLIMWDRQTETWWQQLTGEAIVGELAGRRLTFIPAPIVSWQTFKEAYPDSPVLSRETGHRRSYGTNPYSGYDRVDNPPFLFIGEEDGRLLPKERVVAIEVNGIDASFPFFTLEKERVVNYTVGGEDVVVFFEFGTQSALDQRSIDDSRDIGSTGVFVPEADGRKLTFRLEGTPEDGSIVDNETGSTWSILGSAISGPLAGTQLERIVHQDHFWFAWAAFKPNTLIYAGAP